MLIPSPRPLSLLLCCALLAACGRKTEPPATPPAPAPKAAQPQAPASLTDSQAEAEKARQAQLAAEAKAKALAEAKAKALTLQTWRNHAKKEAANTHAQAIAVANAEYDQAKTALWAKTTLDRMALDEEAKEKTSAHELQVKTINASKSERAKALMDAYMREKDPQKKAALATQRKAVLVETAGDDENKIFALWKKDWDARKDALKLQDAATQKVADAAYAAQTMAIGQAFQARINAIGATKEVSPQALALALAQPKTPAIDPKLSALQAWKQKARQDAEQAHARARMAAQEERNSLFRPLEETSAKLAQEQKEHMDAATRGGSQAHAAGDPFMLWYDDYKARERAMVAARQAAADACEAKCQILEKALVVRLAAISAAMEIPK